MPPRPTSSSTTYRPIRSAVLAARDGDPVAGSERLAGATTAVDASASIEPDTSPLSLEGRALSIVSQYGPNRDGNVPAWTRRSIRIDHGVRTWWYDSEVRLCAWLLIASACVAAPEDEGGDTGSSSTNSDADTGGAPDVPEATDDTLGATGSLPPIDVPTPSTGAPDESSSGVPPTDPSTSGQ